MLNATPPPQTSAEVDYKNIRYAPDDSLEQALQESGFTVDGDTVIVHKGGLYPDKDP